MRRALPQVVKDLADVLAADDLSPVALAARFGNDVQDVGPFVLFQVDDDGVSQAQAVKDPTTRAVAHVRLDLSRALAVDELELALGPMSTATGDDRFEEIKVLELPAKDSGTAVTILAYVADDGIQRIALRVDRD